MNRISENDQNFADAFDEFVNGKMSSPSKVAAAMGEKHRYCQNEMWKVCRAYMKELAYAYVNGRYDARNEQACKEAVAAYGELTMREIVYDPEFGEKAKGIYV